jgi:hypothetical protein
MMWALRTRWVNAVGTTSLSFHTSPLSIAAGVAGGVIASTLCTWWTLRSLRRISERRLLSGELSDEDAALPARSAHGRSFWAAAGFGAVGIVLMIAGSRGLIGSTTAFFGAGLSLLVACLGVATYLLGGTPHPMFLSSSGRHVWRLGLRSAAYRPGRSIVAMGVIAAATFIVIAVDAFRRDDVSSPGSPHSGTGGYALLVESLIPIAQDPNSPEGRELLDLVDRPEVAITPLRLSPGDDASCLNLYAPKRPRVLGVSDEFIAQNRFTFQATIDREGTDNPWRLLERDFGDGTVPVAADANSMTYVLHRSVGDELTLDLPNGEVRLRFVAALRDSVFQSELLMTDVNFRRLFPDQQGYSVLLVGAPQDQMSSIANTIEDRLADFGADAIPTGQRLAEFHRVENTYLSTFQTLGGLGLLLGTIGLAAVLLRNVLERRREIAMLRAVGYGPTHLFTLVVSESALLLIVGLAVGTVCALIAIAPAAAERGAALPLRAGAGLMLFGVFGTGIVASVVAARAALRGRLLDALRSE